MLRKIASSLLCLLPLIVAAERSRAATVVNFSASINTAFLSANPSNIDFQFSQGDQWEVDFNTAEVSGLNVIGAPSDFILTDGFVNGNAPAEYYFSFTAGPVISFDLALTAYVTPNAVTPDLFSILIEDQWGNPVTTTDAAGSSVLSFMEPLTPEGLISVATYDTPGGPAFNPVAAEVPEPSTLVLAALLFLFPATLRLRVKDTR